MPKFAFRCPPPCVQRSHLRGFSLVELVVVIIIVGVLAAIAVPRYIALGRDARVAAVNAMAATLNSITQNVHVTCKLDPTCDYNLFYQAVTIGGQSVGVVYAYPDSGNPATAHVPGAQVIDQLIDSAGFTTVYAWPSTIFTLDGAPTPADCSASFTNAYYRGPVAGPLISTIVTGC